MHCGEPRHNAEGPCLKCGKEGVSARASGTFGLGLSLGLRTTKPVVIDGKRFQISVLKTNVVGLVEDRTVKRTVEGESADLQLKFVKNEKGTYELVHVHCLKDKDRSEWSRTMGVPLDRLYVVTRAQPSFLVTCRICHRTWSSGG